MTRTWTEVLTSFELAPRKQIQTVSSRVQLIDSEPRLGAHFDGRSHAQGGTQCGGSAGFAARSLVRQDGVPERRHGLQRHGHVALKLGLQEPIDRQGLFLQLQNTK